MQDNIPKEDSSSSIDTAVQQSPASVPDTVVNNPVTSFNSGDIKDELFIALRRHPKVRKLCEKIEFLSQFLLLFGLMFFVFGIVSIFYQHKKALTLVGLASILHVVAGPLGLVAVQNNNRYMLLSLALLNIVWIGFVSAILVYFIFLISKNDPTRKVFENEIVIHVGMFIYMPIAGFTAFYCFYMLSILSVIHHELSEMFQEKGSIGSMKEAKDLIKRNIPTDIFQSLKEPKKETSESSFPVTT